MSDEVSQFLESVERLRGQQIEEDEVRARELEDYLAAKRERQARRQGKPASLYGRDMTLSSTPASGLSISVTERARSISPQKSSPANTPSPRSNRRSVHLSDALKLESPGPSKDETPEPTPEPERKPDIMANPPSVITEDESSTNSETKPMGTATTPARAAPLSWQRRPSSRSGGRPLSVVATQNATQRSLVGSQEPASATEQTFSKDQIAQALGSKDPAFFRQTADRGVSSAAYRKNQVEDEDRSDVASGNAQLPGMSNNPSKQMPPPESTAGTPTKARLASPPPLNPPRFDGPSDDKPLSDRPLERTPTGRTSPLRSTSPTKGMGGFVQSAMMKRSDSVKRWSVTSPPGLVRADSIASSRGGAAPITSRPQSMTRPESTTPSSSRPTSRHGEMESDSESTPKAPKTDTSFDERTPKTDSGDGPLPTSPSKTMDPRRWSPTKSSWLESALNKPESPKLQHKAQNSSQPAWMAELNKNKSGKAGTGAGAGPATPSSETGGRPRPGSISHRHQVSIGGLMRSSPMGSTAKVNTTGLGGIYSPPPGGNRPPAFGHNPSISLSKSAPKLEPAEAEEKPLEPVPEPELEPELGPVEERSEPKESEKRDSVTIPEKRGSVTIPEKRGSAAIPEKRGSVTTLEASGPPAVKSKPETPPKKDFRNSLKHRPTGSDSNKPSEPEFKNVFGNLRRTRTQNYVAPDELKGNILRGKAALSTTDGPKKSEQVDEFKDAILKKKDAFKKAQTEGKGITRTSTTPLEKPLPEGLARRAELGRSLSTKKREPSGSAPVPHKKPESPKPTPGPKRISSQTAPSPKSPSVPFSTRDSKVDTLKRVSTESSATPAEDLRALPSLQKETSAPSRLQGRVGGGKLANRFNPALAGMLARGPPPATSNGEHVSEDTTLKGKSGASGSIVTEPSAPGPQLTHMTKGRARGPRRKAPTAAVTPDASVKTPTVEPPPNRAEAEKPKPLKQMHVGSSKDDREIAEKPALADKKDEEVSPPLSIQQQVAAKAAFRGRPLPVKPTEKKVPEKNPEPFKAPALPELESRKDPALESFKAPRPLPTKPMEKKLTEKTSEASEAPALENHREPTLESFRATRSERFNEPEQKKPLALHKQPATIFDKDVGDMPSPLKIQKTGDAASPKKLNTKRISKFIADAVAASPKEPAKLTHQRTGSRSPVKMFERDLPERSLSERPLPEHSLPELQPQSPTKVDREPVVSVKSAAGIFGRASATTPPPAPKLAPKPSFDGPAPELGTPKSLTRERPLPTRPLPEQEPPSPTKVDREPVVSVKNAGAIFGRASPKTPQAPKPSFDRPSPKPESPKPSFGRPSPKPESPKPLFGRPSTKTDSPKPLSRGSSRPLPPPPVEEKKSPAAVTSPSSKQGNEVATLLHDFFGPRRPRKAYKADAAEVLMNRPQTAGRINTLDFRMYQISGDGKKVPVPAHYERILFEREMYLCPHSFTNEAGWKRLEIYFWVGDEVSQSAAEDAHLFVQREVRALGGKLIKINQGKETAEFFQALGGVATIRRGSSNKHDSLAPNILCGRRYLGQVAFDEVDFTPASLCSGFPYLITLQGMCYLWIGKGSDVDELSCARLIGMDLTLTGELIECEDGKEPESFWDLFGKGPKAHSADHWRLKPNYSKYGSRLFCSDADTTQQISELSPFSQSDLSPEHIYIIDAFFEMYIIVGSRAQSQYASFRNALDFAQEYAILASSMEDRPFVPISTVVLEGIPRDLKRVFRKWRDALSPTASNPGGGNLQRGRSLRVVSLTQALQALSE
ncbi:hypothetical protein G7046_g7279 [Stylonectria norvegica]|nr:hypothetical protein G7046_g7279 [Stylonectria norvegica]